MFNVSRPSWIGLFEYHALNLDRQIKSYDYPQFAGTQRSIEEDRSLCTVGYLLISYNISCIHLALTHALKRRISGPAIPDKLRDALGTIRVRCELVRYGIGETQFPPRE